MATKKTAAEIIVKRVEKVLFPLTLEGDTPLIMHAWSQKAKQEMLDAQMGKKKGTKKDPKNPEFDFVESLHWIEGKPEVTHDMSMEEINEKFMEAVENGAKFGFPCVAIKEAAVSAAYRQGLSKDKVSLRGAFFVKGASGINDNEFVEIKGEPPIMREDMVRIGMGTADIRYRGEFKNWTADIIIEYNKNSGYTPEAIINMIDGAGFVCGLGEWRPEKAGNYGMFHVHV